ncbi:hypothetical protein VTI74DRAFT_10164 [Chaetomium olivicolor]
MPSLGDPRMLDQGSDSQQANWTRDPTTKVSCDSFYQRHCDAQRQPTMTLAYTVRQVSLCWSKSRML